MVMAKLILKQQEPLKGSWFSHYGSQIAYAGFIVLLLAISLGVLFTFKPSSVAVPVQVLPLLTSATDAQVKSQYLSDWNKLIEMQASYERLAKMANSREQAQILLNQAEMTWQHLLIMTEATEKLGLNAQEKAQLSLEQAYQQDQWQAQIHFAELRLERFSEQTPIANASVEPNKPELASTQVVDTLPNNKFIAQPPAGVQLPAGFCTLNGSGVCKPENTQ